MCAGCLRIHQAELGPLESGANHSHCKNIAAADITICGICAFASGELLVVVVQETWRAYSCCAWATHRLRFMALNSREGFTWRPSVPAVISRTVQHKLQWNEIWAHICRQ
jgi:hypothetical protein